MSEERMATSKKRFLDLCEIEVEVSTNARDAHRSGERPGANGDHYGWTTIAVRDYNGNAHIEGEARRGHVELRTHGDSEASVLADALTWAGQELRDLIEQNKARIAEEDA